MSKERGEELFRALNVILDAVSSLNLKDLEAKAKADRRESSSKAAAKSSKEKDKVTEPDWENIPFNPVLSLPCLVDLVLLRSLGLLRRQWLLLVLVRPFSALLVVAVEMDVVVVLVVPLAVPLVVLLAVPDGAPVLARAPAPAAATTAMAMVMAMAVAVALAMALAVALEEALEAALNMAAVPNSHPWRTTRRPSFWECGTTVPPTWLVRTWNNKPSPAPQLRRSKLWRWSRSTCVCRQQSAR
jgi:hypothetical protein